ncbi:MAG: hypothetical protein EOO20_28900 [Chryseobacterium sp.]|nr:MAG: hypothetical protein EOO20_28900 [Chryseobacterium sp.]
MSNNNLKFRITENGGVGTGVITEIGSSSFGFAVGDEIYRAIGKTGTGTYTALGKYTYGPGNQSSGYRNSILELQNNNTQLKVTQPALNASFPEIIYIYQKQ